MVMHLTKRKKHKEKQFHITHSWERQKKKFHYAFTLCQTISCHMLPFREAFSCHFQYTCILAKHMATYSIYTYTTSVQQVLHIIQAQRNHHGAAPTKCWPKGGASPNMLSFSCFLAPKTQAWVPRPKVYLGKLSQSLRAVPKFINGSHSSPSHFHKQKTQNCVKMPLRHLTEHLVGAPLGMKKSEMRAMCHAQMLQNAPQA